MPETPAPLTLTEKLALERLDANLFRGFTYTEGEDVPAGRIFGGQVVAQALAAAYATVEDRLCHSLHGYFLRAGDPAIPIVFEVDRARDGGSFTARRVIAIQDGKQIFNLAASFQAPEDGLEHQAPMPAGTLPDGAIAAQMAQAFNAPAWRRWKAFSEPIEMRYGDVEDLMALARGEVRPPTQHVWFRCKDPIPADPRQQQIALAYASDLTLLMTATRPHGLGLGNTRLQQASLDHAIWFHRPMDFNQWHLYAKDSPSASGGRGFTRGLIYAQDGTLVASATQEGLIRVRP
jgi:acyl-CoA thioesterase-2